MERDLGQIRQQLVAFHHDTVPVHDDYLLLKLCGPATAAEFNQGTVAANHDDDGNVIPVSGGLFAFTRVLQLLAGILRRGLPPLQCRGCGRRKNAETGQCGWDL